MPIVSPSRARCQAGQGTRYTFADLANGIKEKGETRRNRPEKGGSLREDGVAPDGEGAWEQGDSLGIRETAE